MTQYQILPACTMSTSVTGGRPGRRHKVFVVDDEPVIADTLAIIIRQAGYDAYPFYGAKTALKSGAGVAPDLLLTDVAMPDLDGIELACTMTDRWPICEVLFLTANATPASLLDDGRAAGRSFEVLRKPLHPNDLLAKIRASASSEGRGEVVSFRRGMPQACNSVTGKQADSSTFLAEISRS